MQEHEKAIEKATGIFSRLMDDVIGVSKSDRLGVRELADAHRIAYNLVLTDLQEAVSLIRKMEGIIKYNLEITKVCYDSSCLKQPPGKGCMNCQERDIIRDSLQKFPVTKEGKDEVTA